MGLDPEPDRMAVPGVFEFKQAIVDATSDLVCAYKPNAAFYEALGLPGLEALASTVDYIHRAAPHVIVIGDAKRGDIGPSGQAYARAASRWCSADWCSIPASGGGRHRAGVRRFGSQRLTRPNPTTRRRRHEARS